MGVGVWGMGDGALAPTPNPQSPIPNPQSPLIPPFIKFLNINILFLLKIQYNSIILIPLNPLNKRFKQNFCLRGKKALNLTIFILNYKLSFSIDASNSLNLLINPRLGMANCLFLLTILYAELVFSFLIFIK